MARCPARGCKEKTDEYMCLRHWEMLPKALRDHLQGHYDRDMLSEGAITALRDAVEFIWHEEAPSKGLQWKPVVGFEGMYEVSQHGQVRDVRSDKKRRWEVNSANYPQIKLYGDDGSETWMRIHEMVAHAFIGPCPPEHEINHEGGNKMRPHAAELMYRTKQENHEHAKLTGLVRRSNPLTLEDKEQIRSLCLDGKTVRYAAGRFDVNPTTIRSIYKKLREEEA